MPERTSTKRFDSLEPGGYHFTVSAIPEKRRTKDGKKIFYVFKFETVIENRIRTHTQWFFPWAMNDLLKVFATQGKATKVGEDEYEWDRETVVGAEFDAEVYMETDRNDANKSWSRLRNIGEPLPF
jgi:hypothetical protein